MSSLKKLQAATEEEAIMTFKEFKIISSNECRKRNLMEIKCDKIFQWRCEKRKWRCEKRICRQPISIRDNTCFEEGFEVFNHDLNHTIKFCTSG